MTARPTMEVDEMQDSKWPPIIRWAVKMRMRQEQTQATQAVRALDALDASGEFARDEAESILLSLVPDEVKQAYGRYVNREDSARGVEWTAR